MALLPHASLKRVENSSQRDELPQVPIWVEMTSQAFPGQAPCIYFL